MRETLGLMFSLAIFGYIGFSIYTNLKKDAIGFWGAFWGGLVCCQWVCLFSALYSCIARIFFDYYDSSENSQMHPWAAIATTVFFVVLYYAHKRSKAMDEIQRRQ